MLSIILIEVLSKVACNTSQLRDYNKINKNSNNNIIIAVAIEFNGYYLSRSGFHHNAMIEALAGL